MEVLNLQGERTKMIRERGSIRNLVGHASLVSMVNGRARVQEKMPAPVDEFGIPRVDVMINRLLGQMATETYVWTGRFDLHHMATPKADYTRVEGNVGSAFRGLPAMKVELPRQMHNLSHAIFQVPTLPEDDVMRQAILENDQLRILNGILGEGYSDSETQFRIHDTLDEMVDPCVDIMPSREELADMELYDLRHTVASLLRVRRFAKKEFIHSAVRPRPAPRYLVA